MTICRLNRPPVFLAAWTTAHGPAVLQAVLPSSRCLAPAQRFTSGFHFYAMQPCLNHFFLHHVATLLFAYVRHPSFPPFCLYAHTLSFVLKVLPMVTLLPIGKDFTMTAETSSEHTWHLVQQLNTHSTAQDVPPESTAQDMVLNSLTSTVEAALLAPRAHGARKISSARTSSTRLNGPRQEQPSSAGDLIAVTERSRAPTTARQGARAVPLQARKRAASDD